jgi:hypothetical protein
MSASAPTAPSSSSTTPELPYRKSSIVPQKPQIPTRRGTGNIYSDKLNMQQWRFVEFYMQGEKPYEAAKKAGYAESTCLVAYDTLLNNPLIKEEIQKRFDRYFREQELTEQRLFQSVSTLADANLADYGSIDPLTGKFKPDLRNVPRHLLVCIQEYSEDAQGRPRIKLIDKLAAKALLGKWKGMGTEKVQLTGKDGAPLTIQTLDAIVQQNITNNIQINNLPAPEEQDSLPQVVNNALLKP